jgi:hypothetical protein
MSNQLIVSLCGSPTIGEYFRNLETELYMLCSQLEVIRRSLSLLNMDDSLVEGEEALVAELQKRLKVLAMQADEASLAFNREQS